MYTPLHLDLPGDVCVVFCFLRYVYVKTFIALYDKGLCILGAPETDYAGGGEYGQHFAYATRSHGKHYWVDSGNLAVV